MPGKTITVHIPLFNEEANLPEVFRRVELVAAGEPGYEWDFLLVDNCSTDRSEAICEDKCRADARYRYLRMSRNWEGNASIAAFDHCTGDAMIVLFSDLQDPPEYIPLMLRKWEEGWALVNGVVRARHDFTLLKTAGAAIAYRLIDWLSDARMPRGATDFRLMDRKVVDAVRQCREFPRFTRGLVHWIGFRGTTFEYDRAPRVKGESKAGLVHSVNLALDAILNFSDKPLRMISLFGIAMLFVAFALAVVYGGGRLMGRPAPRGVTTTFVLLLANLGFLSFFLGVIGEYLGRMFVQSKNRPLYFVEKAINLDARKRRG
ncbi:MAG: glycosyltransferase family 2 protein [Myxococcales bacterium]